MASQHDPTVHDHESDPAHVPENGWGEEGGASHLGPATHIESGHPRAPKHAEPEDETATAVQPR